MPDFSFPQTGDVPEFSYFGSLRGTGVSGVVNGFEFTVDFTIPELTVAEGKALINRAQTQTTHPNITPPDNPTDVAIVVELNQKTVSLTGGQLNHIFIQAGVNADDVPQVNANTTDDKPTAASVKIGEVNTAADTVTDGWNRLIKSGVSFPDERAARREAEQSRLRPGTIIFARDVDTQFTALPGASEPITTVGTTAGESLAFDYLDLP
jgi:hypothetical protein